MKMLAYFRIVDDVVQVKMNFGWAFDGQPCRFLDSRWRTMAIRIIKSFWRRSVMRVTVTEFFRRFLLGRHSDAKFGSKVNYPAADRKWPIRFGKEATSNRRPTFQPEANEISNEIPITIGISHPVGPITQTSDTFVSNSNRLCISACKCK